MAEVVRRIRPTALGLDAYLDNPHRGCCTFQHFNGDELFPGVSWSEEGPLSFPTAKAKVIDGYLPTTVSYCRWFWRMMEPEQGKYDFSMIDKSLETCSQRGQTLAVRLMAFGSGGQPQVPDWFAKIAPMEDPKTSGVNWRPPVHDSPEYLKHWGGFIKEFARRYDSNPLLESIDITFIGPWGEGAGHCGEEQCQRFAALWKEAFVRTPRMALIAGHQMRIGVASGSGWRCDCYGDLHNQGSPEVPRTSSWNHMYDAYPSAVAEGSAADAWKSAPIHLETCWVPMGWYQNGYDLDFILQQGLKYHATYWMPKYTRLPDKWMDALNRFSNQLGYRYIYRQALYDRHVKPGQSFSFKSWIENVGVAPIYRHYDFALKFRQGDEEQVVTLSGIDPRQWLPGDAWINQPVHVPATLKKGYAELSAALIDPKSRQARISFANKEVYSDRWLDLGGVEVV